MQKVFVMYKVKPESRSWQAWQETAAVSGMAQVVKDWDNYGDAVSLVASCGDKAR